jgi:hypothetical protein
VPHPFIETFNDNDARDSYLQVTKDFGGVYLVGDKRIVWAMTALP